MAGQGAGHRDKGTGRRSGACKEGNPFLGQEAVVFPVHKVGQELLSPGIVPDALRAPFDRHSFGVYAIVNALPVILDVVCGPKVEQKSHVLAITL